ncbi:MAG: RNA polymerase sigma factor [Saprospiraceae bacterium]
MHEVHLLHIIEGCRQGKARSEEALFRRFAPRVAAIARRYATDEPQANDYVQECFVIVFEKIDRYDPQRGEFEPWLHRLCVNVILQILRKNKSAQATVELPLELPDGDFWEPEAETLEPEKILEAIRLLPNGYREVFNLSVFEEWQHRDIAEALGISESSSRSQLARAKNWLKQKLTQVTRQYEQGLV